MREILGFYGYMAVKLSMRHLIYRLFDELFWVQLDMGKRLVMAYRGVPF
jgi:hypothetical protein